ncbi:unnamed protein product [Prorocentrum cordatum]|uniref:Uncharacterized protein n=1 Tax=Prorocentrum cordatum TaxID=2364126 RepID=A0ABN9S437_9DINO|nr:unnamed protein product [Polarella glacialis]
MRCSDVSRKPRMSGRKERLTGFSRYVLEVCSCVSGPRASRRRKSTSTVASPQRGTQRGDWDNFCHCIAATSMLIPGSMVKEVSGLFYQLMEECFQQAKDKASAYTCISEQHILTQMHLERPGLFHFVDKGYGSMAADLVTQMRQNDGSESPLFDMLTEDEGEVTTPL